MILLDTNVLSEWMRLEPDSRVLNWLDSHPSSDLNIPAISKAEIDYGIAILPIGRRKFRLQQAAEVIFKAFEHHCLALDCLAASHYGQILAQAKHSGWAVSVEDAQIAAIAISQDLTLATRNTGDFENISGLRISNPWR